MWHNTQPTRITNTKKGLRNGNSPAEQQYGGGHSVPQEVDDGTKSVEANDQTHDADNDRVNIHNIRWEYNQTLKIIFLI